MRRDTAANASPGPTISAPQIERAGRSIASFGSRRKAWAGASLLFLTCVATSDMALQHLLGLGNPVTVSIDTSCEYILTPNQHKVRFGKKVDINEFGMRSGPVVFPKPADQYRVLLVGDSVVYGTSRVGQTEIFTGILQRELPRDIQQRMAILNASAGGWAISNEKDYIRSRGIFSSDLVLLVLNSTDLSQPRSGVNGAGSEAPTKAYKCAWCELWARWLKPKIFRQAVRTDAGIDVELNPRQVDENLHNLDEFRSLVSEGHARMGIIFVAFRKLVQEGAQQSAPQELLDWAQKRRVPIVDLTRFESRFATRDFTLDGVHLSVLGNRVVARAIEQNWHWLTAGY